jgi:hypothetical protein
MGATNQGSRAVGAQTDTWHPTLAAAKAQAFHEFGIEEADWQVLEP